MRAGQPTSSGRLRHFATHRSTLQAIQLTASEVSTILLQQVMTAHPTFPVPGLKNRLQLPENVPIADQVVITFVDCCSAGPRLLHALPSSSACTVQRHSFTITDSALQPATCSPTDPSTSSPHMLINLHSSGQQQPQVTFVCINSFVPDKQVPHIVAGLISWLEGIHNASGTPKPPVVVAAACLLTSLKASATDPHVLPINVASLPAGLATAPTLPAGIKLQDSFLAALAHGLYVTSLSAVCLLIPGHKPSVNTGLKDSEETVQRLGQALSAAGLLGGAAVDASQISQLQLLDKWYAADVSGMMYL